MVNNFGPTQMKVKLGETSSVAIFTMMLILLCMVMFFLASAKLDPWLAENTFQPTKAMDLFKDRDFLKLATMLVCCNFATLNLVQLLLSVYFLVTFGFVTEKTLGSSRYFILVLLGLTIPWAVLAWDINHVSFAVLPWEHTYKGSINFFGPTLLIFTIIGAYVVLAPEKKVKFAERRTRARGEIFNSARARPVTERFGLKPRTFVIAFIALAFAFHVALSFFWNAYSSTTLLSALIAIGIGYAFASMFLASAVETFQDSPLKQKALKHFYELVALDIATPDAIRGTAKALGLPVEQVTAWVASGKGKMRVTPDR